MGAWPARTLARLLAHSLARMHKSTHTAHTHTHTSAAGRALSTVPSRLFGLAGRSTRSHRQRPLADLGRAEHECLPFPPCLRRPTPSRLSMSTQTCSLLLEITSVHVPWTLLQKDLELSNTESYYLRAQRDTYSRSLIVTFVDKSPRRRGARRKSAVRIRINPWARACRLGLGTDGG